MKTLFNLIVIALTMASCSDGFDRTEFEPYSISSRSSGLTHAVPPIDFMWHNPGNVLQPDTVCTTYTPIFDPPFICLSAPMYNGVDTSQLWQHTWLPGYYDKLEDVLIYLDYTDFDIVYSDSAIIALIYGTNDVSKLQAKISTRDAADIKTYLSAAVRGFVFYGVLPYQNYLNAAITLKSVRSFNFLGTSYDSLQYISLASTILDAESCKGGQWFADFRFNPYPMTDSIKQLFITAGWEIVSP